MSPKDSLDFAKSLCELSVSIISLGAAVAALWNARSKGGDEPQFSSEGGELSESRDAAAESSGKSNQALEIQGASLDWRTAQKRTLVLMSLGLIAVSGGAFYEYWSTVSICNSFIGDWRRQKDNVVFHIRHEDSDYCRLVGTIGDDNQQKFFGTISKRIATGYLLRDISDSKGPCFTVLAYDFKLKSNDVLTITEQGSGCGLEQRRNISFDFSRTPE